MIAASVLLLGSGAARADEPRGAAEPRVMIESGEVTNVIDAFDDGDVFDLNLSLGFDYSAKSARILRETAIAAPGLTTGGFTSNLLNVANYSQSKARLTPRIDIGIYKDLAAHLSLPIILSNSQSLSSLNGSNKLGGEALAGAPGEQLFGLPFNAPTRSGLEHIAAGLDFDILSQHRDRTKPTWLFGVEGRFSVGTPMHACNANPASGQVQCADPSDVNRNGKQDGKFDGPDANSQRSAGVTRGTIAIEVHTMMSKRIKYVEPYGGFSALFEFANGSSNDYNASSVSETLVNHPPIVGTMTLGMMIIPWENREKFGRLTFDLRLDGQYHSEGRDYSELFDALGSSAAPTLRAPQWAAYKANPSFSSNACPGPNCTSRSIVDEGSQKVFTTGLTDVFAYGSLRASGSVTWQASEYVKFQFGMGYRHDQKHVITGDSPCNPNDKSDLGKSGPCHSGDDAQGQAVSSTGQPNPNYRAAINSVGRRFWVDGSNTFDLFASGVVMF